MSINPRFVLGSLDLTEAPFMVGFGSDFGRPENVADVVDSMLQDGEIVSSSRSSNRSMSLTVYIDESDMLALAEAEARLIAECDKPRNTLSLDPGDGIGATTIFDTFRVQAQFVRDDETEDQGFRAYQLTIPASPFGRSVDEVIVAAVDGPSGGGPTTTVTVDDCSVITGWTSQTFDTATCDGTAVSVAVYGGAAFGLIRTGSIDMTSTDLLAVDWKITSPATSSYQRTLTVLAVTAAGATTGALEPVASGVAARAGYTRTYYQMPATTLTKVELTADVINSGGAHYSGDKTLSVDQIIRTDAPPASGTARQKYRTIDVAGSVRSQASLSIEHATSSLGNTVVYTWPNDGGDYLPPLRPHWLSGTAAVSDPSLVSGGYHNLDTAQVFEVPVSQIPEGTYVVMARLRSDTTGNQSVSWTPTSRMGSTDVSSGPTTTTVVNFSSVSSWQMVPLGRVVLPTVELGPSGVVRMSIVSAYPADSNIDLDEAWLFNTTIGALTVVNCKTGTAAAGGPSNRLWIDSPTVDHPLPTIRRGFAADQSDAFHAGPDAMSWGRHDFTPPSMKVLTVTPGALDASVTLRHYPRWHSHATS